jgi:hypothetical protein
MSEISESDPFSVPAHHLSSAARLLSDARAALSAPPAPPGALLLPLAPGLLARGALVPDAPVLVPLGVGLGAPEDALFAWRAPADARALLDARGVALGALADALATARTALAVGADTNAALSAGAAPVRGGASGGGDDADGWAALESSLANARIVETEDGGSIMMAVEDGREVAYISEFLPDETPGSDGSGGNGGRGGAQRATTCASTAKAAQRGASSSGAAKKGADFDALMRRLDELAKIELRADDPGGTNDGGGDTDDEEDGQGAIEKGKGLRRVRFAEHNARDDEPARMGASAAVGAAEAGVAAQSSSTLRVDILGDVVESVGGAVRPAPAPADDDSAAPRVSRFLAQRRAARGL